MTDWAWSSLEKMSCSMIRWCLAVLYGVLEETEKGEGSRADSSSAVAESDGSDDLLMLSAGHREETDRWVLDSASDTRRWELLWCSRSGIHQAEESFVPDGGICCVREGRGDCFSHGVSAGGSVSSDWTADGLFIGFAYCRVAGSQEVEHRIEVPPRVIEIADPRELLLVQRMERSSGGFVGVRGVRKVRNSGSGGSAGGLAGQC